MYILVLYIFFNKNKIENRKFNKIYKNYFIYAYLLHLQKCFKDY